MRKNLLPLIYCKKSPKITQFVSQVKTLLDVLEVSNGQFSMKIGDQAKFGLLMDGINPEVSNYFKAVGYERIDGYQFNTDINVNTFNIYCFIQNDANCLIQIVFEGIMIPIAMRWKYITSLKMLILFSVTLMKYFHVPL